MFATLAFINSDSERKNVGFGQIGVIFLENLVWQVAAVAFFDPRLVHRRDVAEITDFIRDCLIVVQLIVVFVEPVVGLRLTHDGFCQENVA